MDRLAHTRSVPKVSELFVLTRELDGTTTLCKLWLIWANGS